MDKEKLESLLIDYIDGALSNEERATVEQEIARDESTARLYRELKEVMGLMDNAKTTAPGASLRHNFEQVLQSEIAQSGSAQKGKQIFMQPWVLRVAAAVVLIIVVAVAADRVIENQKHERELAGIRKELEDNKKLMMAMLEDRQSASQRLMGTTVAYETMKHVDDEIVTALVKAMQSDPNTNVRLSALEALGRFYQQPHVRTRLIQSLATQKDPIVEIALIRMLVEMKEIEVVNQLEKITRDDTVIKAVKDEAHNGILKLS